MTGTALLFWILAGVVVLGIAWALTGRRDRVPHGVHNTPHNTPEPLVTPGPEHDGPGLPVERGAGADQNAADRALHEIASEFSATARAAGATPEAGVRVPPNLSLGQDRPNRTAEGKPFGSGDLGRGAELSARHNLEPAVRQQAGGRSDPNLWGEPKGFGGHAPGERPDGMPGTDGRPDATASAAGPTAAPAGAPGSALAGGPTAATDAGRTGDGTTLSGPTDSPTAGGMLAPHQPPADAPAPEPPSD